MNNKYDSIMEKLGYRYVQANRRASPTIEEIDALEAELGYKLPSDYKEFLMKYGVTSTERRALLPDGSSVGVLYGLSPHSDYDIVRRRSQFSDSLPKDILPIANSASGSVFVMSLAGEDVGNIYWWELEESFDRSNAESLAAKDFDSFIRSLSIEKI